MKRIICTSTAAAAAALVWAAPAQAAPDQSEAMMRELAAMRAEMARMAERIDTLETELADAKAKVAATREVADGAAAAAAKAPPVEVAWKGAPELKGPNGWSFKPRGRVQVDAGFTNAPGSSRRPDGFGSEVRRARLGAEGNMPGGFGYKFEVDFAQNDVAITDAFLSYRDKGLKVTVGQHNNFQSLEELTSSNYSSFIERAAFTDAFGFERRVGVSLQYAAGDVLMQGGLFSDNIDDLPGKSWSADGRLVFMPKLGETRLHLGGSVHIADLGETATEVRYRQRPLVHFTGQRFVDTGILIAERELGYGLEAAAIRGRFHAAGEAYWHKVRRPMGASDPTFFGGYAEVGYFFTRGDSRGYKDGMFDRVKPVSPVGEGGIGAIQLNLRYDYLDLIDAGIIGGKQNGYQVSLVWTPTDYTRFMASYGRMNYGNAVYPAAGGDRDYGVDALGVRAQVDF